jgi:hypothetical protein
MTFSIPNIGGIAGRQYYDRRVAPNLLKECIYFPLHIGRLFQKNVFYIIMKSKNALVENGVYPKQLWS